MCRRRSVGVSAPFQHGINLLPSSRFTDVEDQTYQRDENDTFYNSRQQRTELQGNRAEGGEVVREETMHRCRHQCRGRVAHCSQGGGSGRGACVRQGRLGWLAFCLCFFGVLSSLWLRWGSLKSLIFPPAQDFPYRYEEGRCKMLLLYSSSPPCFVYWCMWRSIDVLLWCSMVTCIGGESVRLCLLLLHSSSPRS